MEPTDGAQCICLITDGEQSGTIPENSVILGAPFFRNFVIMLNFESSQVTIASKEVNSPLHVISYSDKVQ